MKKLLTLLLLLTLTAVTYAQEDVTKFLGIPVDGTKSAMIQKLKAKGFTYDSMNGCLTGEFNGSDVNIYIGENKGKVWRIMVCDSKVMDKESIRIRFNNLCDQFKFNPKYVSFDDYKLSEDEDIAYEITVNAKKYDALFYQSPSEDELKVVNGTVDVILKSTYTAEQLENPTDEMNTYAEEVYKSSLSVAVCHKSVWFRICEFQSQYYITIFYDNERNKANGEDL